jgi:oligosaccharide repeat unit polymerase
MSLVQTFCILLISALLLAMNLKIHKDIIAPAVLLNLVWLFVELFSFISAPNYYFSFRALIWIQVMLLLFSAGSAFVAKTDNLQKSDPPDFKWIIRLQFITLASAPLAIASMIRDSDLGFPLSVSAFIELTQQLTVGRYAGEHLSMLTMGLLSMSYIGCLNGGFLLGSSNRMYHRVLALSILPLLIGFALVYTARATFLFGFLFFVSTFLLSLAQNSDINKTLFKPRAVRWIGISVASVLSLFLITQIFRSGQLSFEASRLVSICNHLRVWFSGNLSGFSFWYESSSVAGSQNTGNTIAGLLELIGSTSRKPGIYDTAFDASGEFEWTNIFTLFRYLMDDFGDFGTLIFLAMSGWVSTRLYQFIKVGNMVALGLLSGITATILFSFVTSVMAYNTVLFAWMGYCLFLSTQRTVHAETN